MTTREDPSRGTAAPWFRRSAPAAFQPPEVRRASDPDATEVHAQQDFCRLEVGGQPDFHRSEAEARPDFHRPELRALSDADQRRVLGAVRSRGLRCPGCGRRRFTVGDALFLGFLFAADGKDDYMVALTCRHRGCPAPRTGIRLTHKELHG